MVEGKSHLVYRNLDIRDILNLSVEKNVRDEILFIHKSTKPSFFFFKNVSIFSGFKWENIWKYAMFDAIANAGSKQILVF